MMAAMEPAPSALTLSLLPAVAGTAAAAGTALAPMPEALLAAPLVLPLFMPTAACTLPVLLKLIPLEVVVEEVEVVVLVLSATLASLPSPMASVSCTLTLGPKSGRSAAPSTDAVRTACWLLLLGSGTPGAVAVG